MKLIEFYDKVMDSDDMTIGVVSENDCGVLEYVEILYIPLMLPTKFPIETILEHTWEDIEAIISNQKDPNVLSHMSRVVGYNSRINNWNKSKQEENLARHRGNYVVPE